MWVAQMATLGWLVAHGCPTRLEILEIAAGRNLQPLSATSSPHFDVILDRRRKTEIARTHLYDAMGKLNAKPAAEEAAAGQREES